MKGQHTTLMIIFGLLAGALVSAWFLLPTDILLGDRGNSDTGIDNYAVWERGDSCFILEVADTMELRRQGLSDRRSLESDRGMLFLYDLSGEYGFWMKDMHFPLDIIWLDKNNEIVTILPELSPATYPDIFYPDSSARKVIEVSAGVADHLELETGDMLNVSAPTTTPPVDCAML